MAENEPGTDMEGSNNVLVDIVEENKDEGDEQKNNQVDVLIVEERARKLQVISSPPKEQEKSPTLETKLLLSIRALQSRLRSTTIVYDEEVSTLKRTILNYRDHPLFEDI